MLHRVKEERHISQIIIGHILHRNCLLTHIIEVKIQRSTEVTGRRRRRRYLFWNEAMDLSPDKLQDE